MGMGGLVRAVSGGLALAAGAWSVYSSFLPTMEIFKVISTGIRGTAPGVMPPVPMEFNIILGLIVLVTGIVVITHKMGESPWPGALILVYGVLMALSGIVTMNWIFSSPFFISIADQDPQAIALSGLMPAFGVAMLASGSFMLLRGNQTDSLRVGAGRTGLLGGMVPLASGFMCGGVGVSAIMFVIPNACCGGSLPGGPVFLIQSGPIPSLFMTSLGTVGLSLGVVTSVNRFFRLPLQHELWCGPLMMVLGVGMAGSGAILTNWVFNRPDWWFFTKIAGVEGLLSLAAMFGLGGTMLILGFKSWRSRKEDRCERKEVL